MTLRTSTVERLGVRIEPVDGADGGPDPRVLLGLALRDNPRRAQLLVSRVLGKHVPADPRLVQGAALLLGGLVADVLAGRPPRSLPVALLHAATDGSRSAAAALPAVREPTDTLVLGFAETATALGHGVAAALRAPYLHSTRRTVPGFGLAGAFVEEHSHATDHLLLPADPGILAGPRPLVLVDDELSTGRTAVNTITALHRAAPRERYVVAALVDVREGPLTGLPDGVHVDVVSLARARVTLPGDVLDRASALRAVHATGPSCAARQAVTTSTGSRAPGPHPDLYAAEPATRPAPAAKRVVLRDLGWPADVPAGGRHGFAATDHDAWDAALPPVAAALARAAGLDPRERTLVLGTEELMALPLRLAAALADAGHDVAFSTTTRSPAVVADEPDYALTSAITFPAHDDPADGPGPRFAYNVARGFDHALVVVDPAADTPALGTGLLAALTPHVDRLTVVVTP